MKHVLAWVMMALLTGACASLPSAHVREAAATCQQDLQACVDEVIAAHGGMELFRRWRFASYVIRDHWDEGARQLAMPWPQETNDIVLHADRMGFHVAVTLPGTPYALGVDDDGGWGTGGKSGLPTVAARYGAGTSFVLALPFRLKDDGAQVHSARAMTWHSLDVIALSASFSSSTSRTPRDRWTLYVDPVSRRLVGCTFFASEYSLDVDVYFQKYLNVGGLWLPSYAVLELAALRMRFHVVEMLQAQLFEARPSSLVDGPLHADRAGEPWRPHH